MARTAVIAGTATAVSGKVASNQHQKQMAQQQAAQQAAAPPQAAPAPDEPAGDDPIAQIQQLAQLHAAGILTDEEFAAKKAQLLGI